MEVNKKKIKISFLTPIDDFLPVLICVLGCSNIKNIFTQINFIKHLASDESLVSEEGYYFSSLESAAHFIATYDENHKNE